MASWPSGHVVEYANELDAISASELRQAMKAYTAYFGTYSIDDPDGIVTHHVEADNWLDYTGTDQPRKF